MKPFYFTLSHFRSFHFTLVIYLFCFVGDILFKVGECNRWNHFISFSSFHFSCRPAFLITYLALELPPPRVIWRLDLILVTQKPVCKAVVVLVTLFGDICIQTQHMLVTSPVALYSRSNRWSIRDGALEVYEDERCNRCAVRMMKRPAAEQLSQR